MAVFRHVYDHWLLPAKQEVADSEAQRDSHTQPHVVSHEDQHQEVANDNLDQVQERLESVAHAQHSWPAQPNKLQSHL